MRKLDKHHLARLVVIALVTIILASFIISAVAVFKTEPSSGALDTFLSVLLLCFSAVLLPVVVVAWLYSILGCLVNMIRMFNGRAEGISLHDRRLGYNPTNLLWKPEYLNEQGLKARRELSKYFFVLILAGAGTILLMFSHRPV